MDGIGRHNESASSGEFLHMPVAEEFLVRIQNFAGEDAQDPIEHRSLMAEAKNLLDTLESDAARMNPEEKALFDHIQAEYQRLRSMTIQAQ